MSEALLLVPAGGESAVPDRRPIELSDLLRPGGSVQELAPPLVASYDSDCH